MSKSRDEINGVLCYLLESVGDSENKQHIIDAVTQAHTAIISLIKSIVPGEKEPNKFTLGFNRGFNACRKEMLRRIDG